VASSPTTHDFATRFAIAGAIKSARQDYGDANPQSRQQFLAAGAFLPGGNTRSVLHYEPFPLSMQRAARNRLWDFDGHEYGDHLGEFTAGLYGHSNVIVDDGVPRDAEAWRDRGRCGSDFRRGDDLAPQRGRSASTHQRAPGHDGALEVHRRWHVLRRVRRPAGQQGPVRPDTSWSARARRNNHNVLSVAAGVATLGAVYTAEAAQALNARSDALRNRRNAMLRAANAPTQWTGLGSPMSLHCTARPIASPADAAKADPLLQELFFFDVIGRGIYLARHGFVALSLCIADACDRLLAAMAAFLRERSELLSLDLTQAQERP